MERILNHMFNVLHHQSGKPSTSNAYQPYSSSFLTQIYIIYISHVRIKFILYFIILDSCQLSIDEIMYINTVKFNHRVCWGQIHLSQIAFAISSQLIVWKRISKSSTYTRLQLSEKDAKNINRK